MRGGRENFRARRTRARRAESRGAGCGALAGGRECSPRSAPGPVFSRLFFAAGPCGKRLRGARACRPGRGAWLRRAERCASEDWLRGRKPRPAGAHCDLHPILPPALVSCGSRDSAAPCWMRSWMLSEAQSRFSSTCCARALLCNLALPPPLAAIPMLLTSWMALTVAALPVQMRTVSTNNWLNLEAYAAKRVLLSSVRAPAFALQHQQHHTFCRVSCAAVTLVRPMTSLCFFAPRHWFRVFTAPLNLLYCSVRNAPWHRAIRWIHTLY